MKKNLLKFFVALCMLGGVTNLASASDATINGILQLEDKMSLNIVNRLQTIADNDNVSFSKDWPSEAFVSNPNKSFFYIVKNDFNSLELVRFEYSKNDENCFTGENPDFCVPKISPIMSKYSYNKNRYLVENTPDFVNAPTNLEKLEVLIKDGKFFDNKYSQILSDEENGETYKSCNFDSDGLVTDCMTYDKNDDSLLYVESLERRINKTGLDGIYKYVKISADGDLLEEYYYSTGVHTVYNKDGQVEAYSQVNEDKFCYYTTSLPDLYIDTVFEKDEAGNVVKEKLFDRNHKLLREYSAKYDENNNISDIKVNDYINGVDWSILPIRATQTANLPFKIRF